MGIDEEFDWGEEKLINALSLLRCKELSWSFPCYEKSFYCLGWEEGTR